MVATASPTDRVNPLDAIGTATLSGDMSADALKRSKLDFDVELVPVRNPETGKVICNGESDDPKYFYSVRKDTKAVLGIVESRYRAFQNRDVFSIADTMVEEDGARITRASALDDGSRCFMNLEWPKDKSVSVLGDIVSRRAIIQNSHDGKYSAIIRLMPLRLACLNGMVIPVPAFSFEFRIRHTESGADRLNEARKIMSKAGQYFDTFGQVANRMARTELSVASAKLLLKAIPLLGKSTPISEKKRSEIIDLFDGGQAGARHEAMRGTAWGFLNAVGEYADHAGRVRKSGGRSVEIQRFKSAIEGTGSRLKLQAYEAMLKDKDLGLGEYRKQLAAAVRSN